MKNLETKRAHTIAIKTMAVIRHFRFHYHIPAVLSIVSAFIATMNYDLGKLFVIILSLLLTLSFVSSVNNTYDVETDQSSLLMSNQNPIVTGELSLPEAKIINLSLPFLATAVGAFAGPYWIGLPIIGVTLVMIYDVKPFRAKDRLAGSVISPLCECLPFLFGYAAANSSFTFPPWTLCVCAFLYFNSTVLTRHLPDREVDLKLGIRNFSAVYGAEAARRVDMLSTIIAAIMLGAGLLWGGFSLMGIPLLLVSVSFQLRTLMQGADALRNPKNYMRFALGMIPNSVSMVLGVVLRGVI